MHFQLDGLAIRLLIEPRHLILTFNTSIQVYSTTDSLLVRRIPLPVRDPIDPTDKKTRASYPVATSASRLSPGIIWVALSGGRMCRIDWTNGAIKTFDIRSKIFTMEVRAFLIGKQNIDIVIVSESAGKGSQVVAYNFAESPAPRIKLHTHNAWLRNMWISDDGKILVATSHRTVIVGSLPSKDVGNLSNLGFQFFSLEIGDDVTSLDVWVTGRTQEKLKKKKDGNTLVLTTPVVNLALGCARGPILIFGDVLARMIRNLEATRKQDIVPLKHHWHSRAVLSVKWSRDGKSAAPYTTSSCTNIFPRKLPYFRWFRGGPCHVTDRYRQT